MKSLLPTWFALMLGLLVGFSLPLEGCTATPPRVATAAIVSTGVATSTMFQLHLLAYRDVAHRTRERVNANASLTTPAERMAAYDREIIPVDVAFDRRTRAMQALSTALYGAAAVVDATREQPQDLQSIGNAARIILEALMNAKENLREGDTLLGTLPIPPAVDTAALALRGILAQVPPHPLPSLPMPTLRDAAP